MDKSVSNEIRELISYPPPWIVRNGNTIIFTILLLSLALTSLIKYPDVVKGSVTLVAIDGPTTRYFGEMIVPPSVSGKIRAGQMVLIRVEGYPSDQYGYLTGTVQGIDSIKGSGDGPFIKVSLPKGLLTSDKKNIPFRPDLKAGAEVVTDARRLFDRLLAHLKPAF